MRPMAIAGHEVARFILLEVIEVDSGNVARGMKHLTTLLKSLKGCC
jgi:hypothetical protein